MAYISYAQASTGGTQLAEVMNNLQRDADRLRDLAAWISQIGIAALSTNADFGVLAADAQAFNDTVVQINTDLEAFMTNNREKIERLARGS